MLLGILGVALLGDLLIGKGVKDKTPTQGVMTAGEGKIRTSQEF